MLTVEETRVLGSLVEKALTTPQHYPLTENAVIQACNQATNRDPVVSYGEATVRRALINLRRQELARLVHRPSDRSPKHAHRIDEALGLEPAEVALVAVLMLRGPQTVGELRARTARMFPFESAEQVQATLEGLADRPGGALVERLGRRPGQKEERYRQLLTDVGAEPTPDAAQATAATAPSSGDDDGGPPARPSVPETVTALQEDVRRLRADVDELRRRLDEAGA